MLTLQQVKERVDEIIAEPDPEEIDRLERDLYEDVLREVALGRGDIDLAQEALRR